EILNRFENVKVTVVKHEEFKVMTKDSHTVIRTGECTPYSNIILKSGVVF
ncbi:D-ribose pyranase, partial [Lawsonibacter sp. DFI.6.74]|nr:D-ribose pyranase [Lawsonibacter sp. DFI.6.74]